MAGDAGGPVDPLTGDGMYEAFFAGRLASEAVLELLAGEAGVARCLRAEADATCVHLWAAWSLRAALDRFPRTTYALAKGRLVWPVVEKLVTGELPDVRATRGLAARAAQGALAARRAPPATPARTSPLTGIRRARRLMRRGELPPDHARRGSADHHRAASERALGAIGIWIRAGSATRTTHTRAFRTSSSTCSSRGTQSYSALEIAEVFDAMGGELNASTARDYTVVYARVLDEHLQRALDVMTDMVFAPALADLETEREVVLEEIAMIEDTPPEPSTTSSRRRCSATIRSAGPCSPRLR